MKTILSLTKTFLIKMNSRNVIDNEVLSRTITTVDKIKNASDGVKQKLSSEWSPKSGIPVSILKITGDEATLRIYLRDWDAAITLSDGEHTDTIFTSCRTRERAYLRHLRKHLLPLINWKNGSINYRPVGTIMSVQIETIISKIVDKHPGLFSPTLWKLENGIGKAVYTVARDTINQVIRIKATQSEANENATKYKFTDAFMCFNLKTGKFYLEGDHTTYQMELPKDDEVAMVILKSLTALAFTE